MLVIEAVDKVALMASRALKYDVPYSQISPVTFGYNINWSAALEYVLASYSVPKNRFLIVYRIECYTVNFTASAGDYGIMEPPPPGEAYWIRANDASTTPTKIVTSMSAPTHLLCDADSLLGFQGGKFANLIGNIDVSPDGNERQIRTKVYGLLVGAPIMDALLAEKDTIAVTT
jgi:hypothetical protein